MPNSSKSTHNDVVNLTADEREGDSADPEQNLSSARPFEEMRSSPRKKYHCIQQIAPMYNRYLPSADTYFKVECNDISQGGISFYLRRPPGCERFAIVLGQKSMPTVLIGQVVYSREVQHKGNRMYLVGCQFIDRL